MLPFHSGVLQQAMDGGAPITAARIRYTLDEDNGPGVTVRDDVHYWGEINIVKHLVAVLLAEGGACVGADWGGAAGVFEWEPEGGGGGSAGCCGGAG